jgi:cell division protein FtsA
VVNVSDAAAAIAASVEKAERVSGVPVEAAFVGVGGSHLTSVNSRGIAAIARPERGVTQDDVDRAMQGARAIAIPHNQVVLQALPRGFSIDGNEGITEPLGMHGYRLELEAHVITSSESSLQNLVQCVEAAGVQLLGPVPQPIAAAEATLRQSEREAGVILVDIGGGTTDIAIYIDGCIWHTSVISVGGVNITNDVSYGLRTAFDTAEEIKIAHGHAVPDRVRPDETIDVASFGEEAPQIFARRYLAEIIQARVEEIFGLVLKEIKHSGYDVLLSAGVVLCGGTAQLPGIKEVAKEVLGMPVRIGKPGDIEGLVDSIGTPAYATSVGLLRWGLDDMALPPPPPPSNWQTQIKNWFRGLLPG